MRTVVLAAGSCILFLFASPIVQTAPVSPLQTEQLQQARQEDILRQQRLKEIVRDKERAASLPDVPIQRSTPLFLINRIQIEMATKDFQWLYKITKPYLHTNMDGNTINHLAVQLNDALLKRGYTTTRIVIPEQDVSSSVLRFVLQIGYFHAYKAADGKKVPAGIQRAFPLRQGDVLNLRKLEQGLEQLNRLPSQHVTMRIIPSPIPFASDVELTFERKNNLYGMVSVDDSGLKSTGKMQWNTMLGWDHVLQAGDTLRIDLNGDGAEKGYEKGTRGQSLSYTVPYGWDTFSVYANRYNYHQTVSSAPYAFLSEGRTKTGKFVWDHVFYRSQTVKQSLDISIHKRDSHYFFNHMELPIQTQHTTALEIGWNLRSYRGSSVLYTRLGHRMGVGWFNAQPENPYKEGPQSCYHMWLLDVDYQTPLQLGSAKAVYTGSFHGQWTAKGDRLYGLDTISMGNRYTVRGFDGEYTLMGESGWYLRNEIAFPMKILCGELYLAADIGAVYGPGTDILVGRTIAGGAIGVRGNIPAGNTQLFYDAFVGVPFYKPDGYPTKSITCGFMTGWRF